MPLGVPPALSLQCPYSLPAEEEPSAREHVLPQAALALQVQHWDSHR